MDSAPNEGAASEDSPASPVAAQPIAHAMEPTKRIESAPVVRPMERGSVLRMASPRAGAVPRRASPDHARKRGLAPFGPSRRGYPVNGPFTDGVHAPFTARSAQL